MAKTDGCKKRIGIQGVRAAFHDVAARRYFADEEIELVECATFRRLCQAEADGETDFAMMAIENSIAGSILPNYQLLEQFGLKAVGEVYLRIEMCLMALPGQTIADLSVVRSHPMALFQCQEFLARHPHIQAVEANDTAESAKEIAEGKKRGVGAIASRLAADVYGLSLLAEGIETDRQNYTRFLVISRGERPRPNEKMDKSSLRFEVTDRTGSLLEVLKSFAKHSVNMTKLQSVPILGRPYEYSFHVDLEWDDEARYRLALAEITASTVGLVEFGLYKKDARPGA